MTNEFINKLASILTEFKSSDIHDYPNFINKIRTEESNNLDQEQNNILQMLSGVFSFCLQPRQQYPFIPMMRWGNKQSMIPDDLTDENLLILRELTNEVLPPVLMARICDVVWVRNKDYKAAEKAILSYLEYAESPDIEHWFIAADYCRRAACIANELGKKSKYKKTVLERLTVLFERASTEDNQANSPFLPKALIEILIDECSAPDLAKLGDFCEALGDKLNGVWIKDEYYKLAARIFEKSGQLPERSRTYKKLGKSWEEDANLFYKPDGGDGMQISFRLKNAIEAYRDAGEKEKAELLIRKLQEANLLTISQMEKFEFKMDVTNLIRKAAEEMNQKVGIDAINAYAEIVKVPEFTHMRDQVKKQAQEYPLSHSMQSEVLTTEGNVSAQTEGGLSDDGPDLLHGLVTQYDINRKVAYAILDSSRQIILQDSAKQWKIALDEILSNHPMVLEDRINLFHQAITAGVEGDWVVFLHLIIPQLENSFRSIVANAGGKTTTLRQGIMQEIDMNQLLKEDKAGRKELANMLGDDVVWDLRFLLVEQGGPNLRNRVCHGLATSAELNSANAIYLLWLNLFILVTKKS